MPKRKKAGSGSLGRKTSQATAKKTSRSQQTGDSVVCSSPLVFTGIEFYNQRFDCYVNATINGIFSCSKLRNTIMTSDSSNEIVLKLQEVYERKDQGLQYLQSLIDTDTFESHIQQDAAEFLECFLGKLEDVLPVLALHYTIPTIVWNECPSCPYRKNLPREYGKFLRLEIVDNKINIQQLIDNYYTNAETDKPCEDNCGHIMKRMMKVDEPPPVLMIQLKRYNNDLTKKLNDIEPSCNITFHNSSYHLKAIIQHHGPYGHGH